MKAWYKPSVQWLFAFIPVTLIVDRIEDLPAPVVFFCAGLSIIPIAGLIVQATEQIAHRTGDAIWRETQAGSFARMLPRPRE